MTEVSTSSDDGTPATPQASAATVEWDHSGRVSSSKFSCGHLCSFRYDANGNLYAFTYARIAWSTMDGVNWSGRDQVSDWSFSGNVTVGLDGTIRIDRGNVVRTLKLNGTIIDEYADGTSVETVRPTVEVCPADLNASNAPRVFVREPQEVAQQWTASPVAAEAEAGTPPAAKEEENRRVFAGGRRIKKLRDVDTAIAETSISFVDEAKVAINDFMTTTAVTLLEKIKGGDAAELAPFLDKLANTCQRERRVDEARSLHERALQIRRTQQGYEHSDTGINLHALGRIYHEWGRYTEAEQALLDAVKVSEKGLRKARFLYATDAVSADHLSTQLKQLIDSLHSLSSLYHEQQKLHLCNQLYESAASACNSVGDQFRAGINDALESLAAMAAQAELRDASVAGIGRSINRAAFLH